MDLYFDAATRQLLSSICVGIDNADKSDLYGVLCQDLDIIQYFFQSHGRVHDHLGPTIFEEPSVLQLNNELAL